MMMVNAQEGALRLAARVMVQPQWNAWVTPLRPATVEAAMVNTQGLCPGSTGRAKGSLVRPPLMRGRQSTWGTLPHPVLGLTTRQYAAKGDKRLERRDAGCQRATPAAVVESQPAGPLPCETMSLVRWE